MSTTRPTIAPARVLSKDDVLAKAHEGPYPKKHPIDDPLFREWMKENDVDLDFAYGIYDSKWTELYETFKEDTDEREACTSKCHT